MKKYFLTACLAILLPVLGLAQETVHSITVIERENDFYITQMKLWKKVIEKEPANAEAWFNLYKAARYKDFPAALRDENYRKEIDKLIDEMEVAIPNTYEYYYTYAWHNFDEDHFEYLMKAYEIDSTRPKISEDLFTHHYRQGEWAKANHYIKKLYHHQSIAPQLLYFCYNMLACTEENSILFMSGDNDSYPTWMLQAAKGVRPGVATLNTSLLFDKKFAPKALKFHKLKYQAADLKLLEPSDKMWTNMGKFIRSLAAQNPDRKVYVPLSCQAEMQSELKDDLYVVGPVFEYCPNHFDNIAVLKKNWKETLKLDYLDFSVYTEDYLYSPEGLPYTVMVYLYPAATLYNHYQLAGEAQQAEDMLNFMKDISQKMGDPDQYKRYIKGTK